MGREFSEEDRSRIDVEWWIRSIRSTPIDFSTAWEYQTGALPGSISWKKMESSMALRFHECEVSERIDLK